jgi:hypothetical protein
MSETKTVDEAEHEEYRKFNEELMLSRTADDDEHRDMRIVIRNGVGTYLQHCNACNAKVPFYATQKRCIACFRSQVTNCKRVAAANNNNNKVVRPLKKRILEQFSNSSKVLDGDSDDDDDAVGDESEAAAALLDLSQKSVVRHLGRYVTSPEHRVSKTLGAAVRELAINPNSKHASSVFDLLTRTIADGLNCDINRLRDLVKAGVWPKVC